MKGSTDTSHITALAADVSPSLGKTTATATATAHGQEAKSHRVQNLAPSDRRGQKMHRPVYLPFMYSVLGMIAIEA